ncbi:hypothetical protein ACS0TY_010374 [Phlomoides rotata]
MNVTDYTKKFKLLIDQLAAIGCPVLDSDKSRHWFLRGLGPQFSSFSDVCMAITPTPSFHDLAHQARNFELFHQSLDSGSSTTAAFVAVFFFTFSHNSGRGSGSTSGQNKFSHGGSSFSGGRGRVLQHLAFFALCNVSPTPTSD